MSSSTLAESPLMESAGPRDASTAAPLTDEASLKVRLVTKSDGPNPVSVELRRVVTLIGSREHCKLRLRHPRVSPVHLALVNDGASVYAVDLMTRHGTMLNGLKMEHEKLADGDLIEIGPWELTVRTEASRAGARAGAVDFEHAPRIWGLEHMATHRLLQPNRAVCIIGRRRGCDIAISDGRVSRVHALLFPWRDRPVVFDLLSYNQTFVNGEPVGFRVLDDQDQIAIGDSRFRVRLSLPHAGRGGGFPAQEGTEPTVVSGMVIPGSPDGSPDLVDIKATEGSQSWPIVDSLARANRKQ